MVLLRSGACLLPLCQHMLSALARGDPEPQSIWSGRITTGRDWCLRAAIHTVIANTFSKRLGGACAIGLSAVSGFPGGTGRSAELGSLVRQPDGCQSCRSRILGSASQCGEAQTVRCSSASNRCRLGGWLLL